MITVSAHRVDLIRLTTTRGGRTTVSGFRGACSCGATSPKLTTAGMVAGWDATHREEAGEL